MKGKIIIMFELSEKNVKNEIAMSQNLKNATTKINQFQKIAKNSIYAISMILANIAEYPKEYLGNSQFNTVADYAETIFGYKKAYCYKLIKLTKFIKIKNLDGNDISIKDFINNEIEVDYSFDIIKDADGFEYSPSQMLELIPLSKEQIEMNIVNLDSSLTCKELRAIVKDIVNPPIETTASDSTDSTESSEEAKEEIKEFTDKEKIFKMLEICSTLENEEIKQKIINVFQKSIKVLEKNPTNTSETSENTSETSENTSETSEN